MAIARGFFREAASVLKPNGILLYADTVKHGRREAIELDLATAGFQAELRDITGNVTEACRLDSKRRREVIRRHAPLPARLLLKGQLENYAAVEGTRKFRAFAEGRRGLSDDRGHQAMSGPRVTLVVARATNGVIGRDGTLPWRISADLKRFKRLTMGSVMIMGRRTFDSLPGLLPGRRHIVLTRDREWSADGAEVAHSVEEAWRLPANEPCLGHRRRGNLRAVPAATATGSSSPKCSATSRATR